MRFYKRAGSELVIFRKDLHFPAYGKVYDKKNYVIVTFRGKRK